MRGVGFVIIGFMKTPYIAYPLPFDFQLKFHLKHTNFVLT